MTDPMPAEQLELGLELREPAPTPWWSQVVEHET